MKLYLPDPALREALASCAISGNPVAIDALETIRRAEAGEPIGERYADELNAIVLGCAEKFGDMLAEELIRGGATGVPRGLLDEKPNQRETVFAQHGPGLDDERTPDAACGEPKAEGE